MSVPECPRCWKPLIHKGQGWKDDKQYEVYVCPECFTWMHFDEEEEVEK